MATARSYNPALKTLEILVRRIGFELGVLAAITAISHALVHAIGPLFGVPCP